MRATSVDSGSMRVARLSALLLVGLVATGGLPTKPLQAAESISALELRQLFPGRFQAIARGIVKIRIVASADGSLYAQQIGKSDTGVWSVRADRLCIRFTRWLKGRTRCSRVTEQSGWYSTRDVKFRRVSE
jgi:hypothetical protein